MAICYYHQSTFEVLFIKATSVTYNYFSSFFKCHIHFMTLEKKAIRDLLRSKALGRTRWHKPLENCNPRIQIPSSQHLKFENITF